MNQKWTAVGVVLGLVVLFLVIRRLPALRRTEYSQTD
jgi:hypothetical protein